LTQPLPPPTPDLKGLCDLCGSREAALALIEAHGGTAIYVPQRHEKSDLRDTLDAGLIERLRQRYAGDWMRVPQAKAWRVQVYRGRGMTIRDIALRLTMTESGVYKSLRLAGLSNTLSSAPTSRQAAGQQLDLLDPIVRPLPPQG
jgi:hypothetical protein